VKSAKMIDKFLGEIMRYPPFYDDVETITLYDPLAEILGSFEKGEIRFKYTQIVKAAGHSCPTVAGAYLMTLKALEALYPDSQPVRGEIKVAFKESMEEGVAGVIANVISNITGATEKSGFKGLGGKFARHSLMEFGADIDSNARFTRTDTNQSVDVFYNPQIVPANPDMQPLMQKIMRGVGSAEEKKLFGEYWQERVKEILTNYQNYKGLIEVKAI
jgi:formylmethanofuran dehydrogenase subunit E